MGQSPGSKTAHCRRRNARITILLDERGFDDNASMSAIFGDDRTRPSAEQQMTDDRSTQRKLTVVVAAWTGHDSLQRCLRSLLSQVRPGEDEIIVARNFADDLCGPFPAAAEFPTVADFGFAHDTNVPTLRAAGLVAAKGNVVAFLEDHCVCVPGWRDAIMAAHDLPVDAVGGPVDLASGGRPLDWAVYFYDYARFAPPLVSGQVYSLSGANMSFKNSFLVGLGTALQDGVMEVILEQESTRRGTATYMASDAVVIHGNHHSFGSAVVLAFALAQGYASRRVLGKGTFQRIAFSTVTPLLPLLLMVRIVAAILRTKRNVFRLMIAFPWLVTLVVAWSFGECVGYLAGEGNSQRRWR